MEFAATGALVGLFLSAFTSATLLPGTSEAALAALLAAGAVSTVAAIGVATVGNVAGSLVNWAIGSFLASYRDHPRFPVGPETFERYAAFYRRFGIWTLLLSWVPVIGDPLTVVAGAMRAPFPVVLLLVTAAKLARYLAVAGVVSLF